SDCIKLLIYACMLAPGRYWIFTKLPFLKLGLTPYTTNYPVHKYSPTLGQFASLLFDKLSILSKTRTNNALAVQEAIREIPGVNLITYDKSIKPVYLRLPVLIDDPIKRNRLIKSLNQHGIGATKSYPASIFGIKQIENKLVDKGIQAEAGNRIADQIITLPTHPYLQPKDIARIKTIFYQVMT
ncbi:MAG: DegT/DnrJ/EryC1/StrS family aminotransferase, partial [Gammaproteobacteria bacterium]|nr:DegT/DnrJ/EryC1/StrS family aminotransferase [Gammaproteobacteria bacterium]